jgi:hypothetical protein
LFGGIINIHQGVRDSSKSGESLNYGGNMTKNQSEVNKETQCSRCGSTNSSNKITFCICNCSSQWKKNDASAILPLVVEEPALWRIPLCIDCISQAYRENTEYLIKKHRKNLITSIICVPTGVGVFLAAWLFVTKLLGFQNETFPVIVSVIFGGIYIISLGTSFVGLILIPLNLIKLIKVKTEKTLPKGAHTVEAQLKAATAEGRRIIDVLRNNSSEHVFGTYCLPIVEYSNLPENMKNQVINKRTSLEYDIVKPFLNKSDLLKGVEKEWQEKLSVEE